MSFLNGKLIFFLFLGFFHLILQQKVVIKLSLEGHKSRSKALKIAVGVSGNKHFIYNNFILSRSITVANIQCIWVLNI